MIQKTILAIETSCDETAVSIVSGKKNHGHLEEINIHAHVVESQTAIHSPFGGVVPEVAARDHLAKIHEVTTQALKQADLSLDKVDAFAVTLGPGLIGALMVGVLFARGLALSSGKPLIGVNHVDAHLAPALLLKSFSPQSHLNSWIAVEPPPFPALALTVSGGHCHLSYLKNFHEKIILGKTLDDACGEAFDKVGKLLGFDYPGGPWIERYAQKKTASKFRTILCFSTKNSRFKKSLRFQLQRLKNLCDGGCAKGNGVL